LIFVPRFEASTSFHCISNAVDNLVHDVEIKSKDYDFGMLIPVKQTCGIGELRADLARSSEDLSHNPSVSFDVGEKLLIGRVKAFSLAEIAGHGLQSTTGRKEKSDSPFLAFYSVQS